MEAFEVLYSLDEVTSINILSFIRRMRLSSLVEPNQHTFARRRGDV